MSALALLGVPSSRPAPKQTPTCSRANVANGPGCTGSWVWLTRQGRSIPVTGAAAAAKAQYRRKRSVDATDAPRDGHYQSHRNGHQDEKREDKGATQKTPGGRKDDCASGR